MTYAASTSKKIKKLPGKEESEKASSGFDSMELELSLARLGKLYASGAFCGSSSNSVSSHSQSPSRSRSRSPSPSYDVSSLLLSSSSSSVDARSPPRKRRKTVDERDAGGFIVYTDNSSFAPLSSQALPPLPKVVVPSKEITNKYTPFLKELIAGGDDSLKVVYASVSGLKHIQSELNGIPEYIKADLILSSIPFKGLPLKDLKKLEAALNAISGKRISKRLQKMLTSAMVVLKIFKKNFPRGLTIAETEDLFTLLKYTLLTAFPFYRRTDAMEYRDGDYQVMTDWPVKYTGRDHEIRAFRESLREMYGEQVGKNQSK
ncbi:hypothetical protein PSACC_00309 [Paramicrosporidium saccamoebae]|uniref:Uncharacterized protein n=1 Tax=Paramicrosporidium saccamoebae TaxID=1246581 RepID=A0A2H9TQ52_9FUNG|nr:hypothetical protein PSACC_00309 [Paramicrosporidium saccamoebae]